jgi:hypothetical protein
LLLEVFVSNSTGEDSGCVGTRLSPVAFNVNSAKGQAAIVENKTGVATRIDRPANKDTINQDLVITTAHPRRVRIALARKSWELAIT